MKYKPIVSLLVMNHLFIWVFLSLLVSFFIWYAGKLFSMDDVVESSGDPFECGMDTIQGSRSMPMFVHFYMVGILFIVFDIELIISLPTVGVMLKINYWLCFWIIFLIILVFGLVFEIIMGTLDWKE